ncbi:MAG: aminoacyl-tRNA deacylase [Planctomycetota bacterium]|jgi:Ala-tRNA(Pro) deacylase
MEVTEYLDKLSARYEITEHRPAFTAQRMAQAEHVRGMNVAKPVVVSADGKNYMSVLPACCKIDFDALKTALGAQKVELVNEITLSRLFPDCEIGAEPPFGSFYGLPTIMDERLEEDDYIIFQSGTHRKAMKMELAEYKRIESPKVLSFSYRV